MTLLMDIIIAFLAFAELSWMISAAPFCKPPTESSLHSKWLNMNHNDHESLYSVELFKQQISNELRESDSPFQIHLYGDQDSTHCNSSHLQGATNLQDRSYCPWYNILNYSPNRYPHTLTEARCRCQYGVGMGIQTACSPVYYNIRVLRKTQECDENGFYKYIPGWQRVSVGCTMIQAL